MEDLYAERKNTTDRAVVKIEVYVDAGTLKSAEEIVQDVLNGDGRISDYAIDFEKTAWRGEAT